MKRIIFLLVSALLAGATYASNRSKEMIAKVTNGNEVSITKQGQSLILEQPVNVQTKISHESHRSHSSHRSHYSSRII